MISWHIDDFIPFFICNIKNIQVLAKISSQLQTANENREDSTSSKIKKIYEKPETDKCISAIE